MPSKSKNKGGNKGSNKAEAAGAVPTPVETPLTEVVPPTETLAETLAEGAGTTETAATQRTKRNGPKNYVGLPDNGGDFTLTDDASIGSFVTAYGRMGEAFDGGYETHFNNCGPMCRKGVERISGQGKAKTIAIFADALAEDAAMAGSTNHGLPKGRSPEEAETLLVGLHAFIGNLITSKRAEIAERTLAKAAAELGIPVEELKALKARQAA